MALPTTEFRAADLATAADPYTTFCTVRSHGPVQRSGRRSIGVGHAEAEAVLRAPSARSGCIAERSRRLLPPGAGREEVAHRTDFLDPPAHTRGALTDAPLRWRHTGLFRGPHELPVVLGPHEGSDR